MNLSVVEIVCDVLAGVCVGGMLIPLVLAWAWRTNASVEVERARLSPERRVFAHVELVPIDVAAAQRDRKRFDVREAPSRYAWPEPMADDLLGGHR